MNNCLIIEDDYISGIDLKRQLEGLGHRVRKLIIYPDNKLTPLDLIDVDILICDVKLGNSIFIYDVLKDLNHTLPVILVSSYSEETLVERCEEVHPYIYLTKPVNSTSLHSAIVGALRNRRIKRKEDLRVIEGNTFIRSKGKLLQVEINKIAYVFSEGNYCYIHTVDKKKNVIRSSLSKILSTMNSIYLIQVHRSFVVNINKLTAVDIAGNLLMLGNQEIPIGGKYKKKLIKTLETI